MAYTLEALADKTGLSQSTISRYRYAGVLPPPVRAHGHNMYNDEHVWMVARIHALRRQHRSLDYINVVVKREAEERLAKAAREASHAARDAAQTRETLPEGEPWHVLPIRAGLVLCVSPSASPETRAFARWVRQQSDGFRAAAVNEGP